MKTGYQTERDLVLREVSWNCAPVRKGTRTSPLQKANSQLLSSVGKSKHSPSLLSKPADEYKGGWEHGPISTRVDEALKDVIMSESYKEC